VGAFTDDAVYVLLLRRNGTVKAEQKISNTTGNFQSVLQPASYFGASITALGDLDDDNNTVRPPLNVFEFFFL
jgi:hypothetical protein